MECYKCIHASHCQEPFPEEKCEKFEEKITAETVMRLFEGMDPSAQKSGTTIHAVHAEGRNK